MNRHEPHLHITAQTTTLALLKMNYGARSISLAAGNESLVGGSLNSVVCAHVMRYVRRHDNKQLSIIEEN